MTNERFRFPAARPLVVGSFGDIAALREATPGSLSTQCDIAEVRLDLFANETQLEGRRLWAHLLPFPLLFTARRSSEGSPVDLDRKTREELLRTALPDASIVDLELASCAEMKCLITDLQKAGTHWIASFHNFEGLPASEILNTASGNAAMVGASAFKIAARLHTPAELATLAAFQLAGSGIPKSTMGMGTLAPVSRLLCAQAGSVLNYGYIGGKETAPGQWSAKQLKEGIQSLSPITDPA